MKGREPDLQRLAEAVHEQHIHFVLDPSPEQWPNAHAQMFARVRDFGDIKFEKYREEASLEIEQKPWMTRLVSSAEDLVTKSTRAVDENQTEDGWRLLLEHDIFAPLMEGTSWYFQRSRPFRKHASC